MYGNHPYGTKHKRDIARSKTMARSPRLTDGLTHEVTRRFLPIPTQSVSA